MLSFLSLLVPTRDQMTSYIRTGIKWVGGALAGYGIAVSPQLWAAFAGPEAVQVYAGIGMAVITALIDRVIHSDAGKLKAASELANGPARQIEPILTLPTAEPAIAALAHDDRVPGVQPATQPVFTPTTKGYRS